MTAVGEFVVEREALAGVYDRNRREQIEAGTKFASVRLSFPWTESDARRAALGEEGLRLVVAAYREAHGPIAWDSAQVVIVHVTCQVIVELRVAP